MKLQLLTILFVVALFAVPGFSQDPPSNGAQGDAPEQELQDGPPTNGNEGDAPEQPLQEEEDEPEEVNGEEEIEDEEEEPKDDEIPEEFKDEVDNVKRKPRFPQLSRKSCLILKRYGYCRRKDIARFCIKQCYNPCRDLLSRRSCWLLRNKYKQCGKPFARFYCRRTCKACKKPVAWRDYPYHWCTASNRSFIKSRITYNQCKALCIARKGCKAIEWWGKYNFNCYVCKNPNKRVRYTNKKDLAWPPHVAVRA